MDLGSSLLIDYCSEISKFTFAQSNLIVFKSYVSIVQFVLLKDSLIVIVQSHIYSLEMNTRSLVLINDF